MTERNYKLKIKNFELTIRDGNLPERHKYAPWWAFSGWMVTFNGREDCLEAINCVDSMVGNHLSDGKFHGFKELVDAFKAAVNEN